MLSSTPWAFAAVARPAPSPYITLRWLGADHAVQEDEREVSAVAVGQVVRRGMWHLHVEVRHYLGFVRGVGFGRQMASSSSPPLNGQQRSRLRLELWWSSCRIVSLGRALPSPCAPGAALLLMLRARFRRLDLSWSRETIQVLVSPPRGAFGAASSIRIHSQALLSFNARGCCSCAVDLLVVDAERVHEMRHSVCLVHHVCCTSSGLFHVLFSGH